VPHNANGTASRFIWQQSTLPYPAVTASNAATAPITPTPPEPAALDATSDATATTPPKKRRFTRMIVIALGVVLALVIYLVWHSSPSTTAVSISQQGNSASTIATSAATATLSTQPTDSTAGTIAVYITGAVQHPGVYMLPPDARVYQALQAAGGALPDANLVALNLASKLSDGEEVYVPAVGESIPPSVPVVSGTPTGNTNGGSAGSQGQLVNINTASADELRQALHISSTTAQNIVNYRVQHGRVVDTILTGAKSIL
jgi:competence protein ComEA